MISNLKFHWKSYYVFLTKDCDLNRACGYILVLSCENEEMDIKAENNIANMSLMLMSLQLHEDLKSVDKEFSVNKYLFMCFYCHELLS